MLTAVLEDGTKISMADKWFESELKNLRKKQQFKCPVCYSSLILKLGSKRQWHFAHVQDQSCRIPYEPESSYHLKGKLDIYHWLMNQGISAALEMYLPLIQQRPDVLCRVNGKLIAIEYQCSSLSEELYAERTKGYYRMGITPIWILGGNRLRRKQTDLYQILGFEWNAARFNPVDQAYLTYYCSESTSWGLMQQITSYSATKALAELTVKKSHSFSMKELLTPNESTSNTMKSWLKIKKNWRYQCFHPHPSKSELLLKKLLYQHRIPPGQFPCEAGWFISVQHYIKTSPYVWQTLLLLQISHHLTLHQPFSLNTLEDQLTPFIMRGVITFRDHLQLDLTEMISQMVFEYIQLLVSFAIVEKLTNGDYLYLKPISLPKTVEQANEMDQSLANIKQNTPNGLHFQR
ncbi:competence protein CoiA [Alkalicoccobacillus murimartini]|uniref:Competence CoiA-like predicted nuclease n=1 Tax=Alkalicoccobacillus murimartini TaxID=171685 RepID=A0ABT9YJ48_9BACI|nr:competence protein CoiA family protein [Alkalicoccobacillus murimartini]MDQ0207890.1 competence CoiA-like predicted nuclease [Alkalicoccobacillus murimartini]